MLTIADLADYNRLFALWAGRRIALVPTMGALHEGHLALIRHARQLADVVVVSIFVNPLQFGPNEDLARYPRPLAADLAACQHAGADAVFHPAVETLYPTGMEDITTIVPPESLTNRLCGAARPGHFTGVATVVLRLFNLLRPHVAVFGEKDAQQLAIIRKMVRDCYLPVEIAAHPTLRDENGLALSSRNRYLVTQEEREAALCLYRILSRVRAQVKRATMSLNADFVLRKTSREALLPWEDSGVSVRLQYLEAVDRETFAPVTHLGPNTKLLIAAYVNEVRLIDNLDLG